MQQAIELAKESVSKGGGPFGAVIVCQDKVVATASNGVTLLNDPTAHAEVTAIREACRERQSYQLNDCEIYASCEPCPMCLSAIYWAGIKRIYYAADRSDAAKAGFSDDFIYKEIPLPAAERSIPAIQIMHDEAQAAFRAWDEKEDKIPY